MYHFYLTTNGVQSTVKLFAIILNPVRFTSQGYNLGLFPCITMTSSVTPDLRYIGKPNEKIRLFLIKEI